MIRYNEVIMESNTLKIKIEDTTLGDMVEYLRAEAMNGDKGRVGMNAIRVTVTKIFRTVYGEDWQNVSVARVDPEEVFRLFRRKGDEYSKYTIETYYMRLKKAFEVYGMKDKKIEAMRITTENFEAEVRKLMKKIDLMRSMFMTAATQYLFTDEARANYNIHAVPLEGGNPVALALPKELDKADAEMIKGMLERTCSRVKIKKKGGNM